MRIRASVCAIALAITLALSLAACAPATPRKDPFSMDNFLGFVVPARPVAPDQLS